MPSTKNNRLEVISAPHRFSGSGRRRAGLDTGARPSPLVTASELGDRLDVVAEERRPVGLGCKSELLPLDADALGISSSSNAARSSRAAASRRSCSPWATSWPKVTWSASAASRRGSSPQTPRGEITIVGAAVIYSCSKKLPFCRCRRGGAVRPSPALELLVRRRPSGLAGGAGRSSSGGRAAHGGEDRRPHRMRCGGDGGRVLERQDVGHEVSIGVRCLTSKG